MISKFTNDCRRHETDIEIRRNTLFKKVDHRLRESLNAILGFAQLLQRPGLSEEKKGLYINEMQNGATDLINTFEQVRRLSKPKQGHPGNKYSRKQPF